MTCGNPNNNHPLYFDGSYDSFRSYSGWFILGSTKLLENRTSFSKSSLPHVWWTVPIGWFGEWWRNALQLVVKDWTSEEVGWYPTRTQGKPLRLGKRNEVCFFVPPSKPEKDKSCFSKQIIELQNPGNRYRLFGIY